MDLLPWILVGVLALVSLVLLAFSVIGAMYLLRGTPVERIREMSHDGRPARASDIGFRRLVEAQVGTELTPGNSVELLFNGDGTYDPLFECLEAAKDTITWHVFFYRPGALADRVKDVLCRKAREGVDVLFLADHYGSLPIADRYWDEMRAAGIEVCRFRALSPGTLYKFQQRSHIRAVIVDGTVGFTGGFAIADEWTGDGRSENQWRDTNVRLRGPILCRLQAAFAADWAEATGELLVGDRLFCEWDDEDVGPHRAGLCYGAPSMGSTNVERLFALSVWGAEHRLYITNAYFIPDDDFRKLLCDAVERGVDVRILVPGENTDERGPYYAARRHYEQLLEGGVRLFEYAPTMVHAKTMTVDGMWSIVGTMNFDNRSMALNDEVAVLAHDEGIAMELEEHFLEDLTLADEVELEVFRQRGTMHRIKERLYVALSRIL